MIEVKSLEQVPGALTQLFQMVGGMQSVLNDIRPQASPETDLMDIDEAADFLKLKRCTLYNMVSKKEVPHYKKRNRLYFSKTALIEWVHSGEVKTKAQLRKESPEMLDTKKGGN